MWSFSKADYVYADQLENLARYFMNPKLADPELRCRRSDRRICLQHRLCRREQGLSGRQRPARCLAFPTVPRPRFWAIVKTSLKSTALKVPETYDELLEIACKIPELEPGMGGDCPHARPPATTHRMRSCCILPRSAVGFLTTTGTRLSTTKPVSRRRMR